MLPLFVCVADGLPNESCWFTVTVPWFRRAAFNVRGPSAPTSATIEAPGAFVRVPEVTVSAAPYAALVSVSTIVPLFVKPVAIVSDAPPYVPLPCTRRSDPDVVVTPAVIAVLPSTNTLPPSARVPPASVEAFSTSKPFAFTCVVPVTVSVRLAADSVCVPLEPPSCKPLTVGLTSTVTVYVPGNVMTTVLAGPGTTPPAQFAGVVQFPPAGFDHAIVPDGTSTSKLPLVTLARPPAAAVSV